MSFEATDIGERTRVTLLRYAREGRTIAWQARRLKLAESTIKTYRHALRRAGLLEPRRTFGGAEDVARVRRLAAQGYSHAGIAERLDVGRTTVYELCRRHGISVSAARADLLADSMVALVALFGVAKSTAELWIRAGWLHPTPACGDEVRRGVPARFSAAELRAFVHVRAAWPSYDPGTIGDAELRDLAAAARAGAGGRWVPIAEVAARAGIAVGTVAKREARGWLAGWEWTTIGRARYLWWPDRAPLPMIRDTPGPVPRGLTLR